MEQNAAVDNRQSTVDRRPIKATDSKATRLAGDLQHNGVDQFAQLISLSAKSAQLVAKSNRRSNLLVLTKSDGEWLRSGREL